MHSHSHRENTLPTNGGQVPAIKQLSGKKLAKQLKAGAIKPDFQNRLAYDLQTGHLVISRLTAKQARMLTGASRAGLAAVRREMRSTGNGSNGTTNKQDRLFYRCSPSDADLDVAVACFGSRLMAAIDRATKPARCERTGEMFDASR